MKRRMNAFTIAGLPAFLVGLSILVPKLMVAKDIWWTPAEKALAFEDTQDRVRVLVGGEPIEELIDNKKIDFTGKDGRVQSLKREHIRMRVNNYHEQRARSYAVGILGMFFASSGLTLLVIGLFVIPKMGGTEGVAVGEPPSAGPAHGAAPSVPVPEPAEEPAPPEVPQAAPKREKLTETGLQRKRAAITQRIVSAAEKEKAQGGIPALGSTLGLGGKDSGAPGAGGPSPGDRADAGSSAPPQGGEGTKDDVHLAEFLNEDEDSPSGT